MSHRAPTPSNFKEPLVAASSAAKLANFSLPGNFRYIWIADL